MSQVHQIENNPTNPVQDSESTTIITDGNLFFLPLANDCVFMISGDSLRDGHNVALARGNVDPGATSFAGESPFDSGTHVVTFKEMFQVNERHPQSLTVQTLTEFANADQTMGDALGCWSEWAEDAYGYLANGADVDDAFRLAATGIEYGATGSASGL